MFVGHCELPVKGGRDWGGEGEDGKPCGKRYYSSSTPGTKAVGTSSPQISFPPKFLETRLFLEHVGRMPVGSCTVVSELDRKSGFDFVEAFPFY